MFSQTMFGFKDGVVSDIMYFTKWCYDKLEVNTMTEQQLLERITVNPKVMVGKPVIKGTWLSVEYILGLLAHGATITEILEEYEGLTQEDIQACFLFVAWSYLYNYTPFSILKFMKQSVAEKEIPPWK